MNSWATKPEVKKKKKKSQSLFFAKGEHFCVKWVKAEGLWFTLRSPEEHLVMVL